MTLLMSHTVDDAAEIETMLQRPYVLAAYSDLTE